MPDNKIEPRKGSLNPIQGRPFRGCSRMGGLGTVIPYLKKIKKLYESRDAPIEFF